MLQTEAPVGFVLKISKMQIGLNYLIEKIQRNLIFYFYCSDAFCTSSSMANYKNSPISV